MCYIVTYDNAGQRGDGKGALIAETLQRLGAVEQLLHCQCLVVTDKEDALCEQLQSLLGPYFRAWATVIRLADGEIIYRIGSPLPTSEDA